MSNPGLDKKLRHAAKKGNLAEIARLLDAGADIEGKGGFFSLGQTPLAIAVWYGRDEAVRLLLERGANTEARDDSGDTPLLVAATFGRDKIAELLLEHGADPRVRGEGGEKESAADIAREHHNFALSARLETAVFEAELRERIARETARQEREQAARAQRDAERRKDADIVIVNTALGDRTLQEIYNFNSLERISLVRNGDEGPVEAITRQDFSGIGDKPCLRQAFAEHVRRGGTADEDAVFPNSRPVIKPLQRPLP